MTMPWTRLGVRLQSARIHDEDNAACENLQRIAWPGDANPILARQETRVGWFQQDHERLVSGNLEPSGLTETASALDG
jgi:hypothetical protein